MTNKEINEFLAENLFGLEKMDENPSYFYTDKTKKWVLPSDDYILNYQPVLEKLELPSGVAISIIKKGGHQLKDYCLIRNPMKIIVQGEGETLGEAVCKAAVEYLKLEEK